VKFEEIYKTVKFTLIKLPFIYLLILIGYVLELMVEFPWLIMCRWSEKQVKKLR